MNSGGQEQINWLIQLSKSMGIVARGLDNMPSLYVHLVPKMDAFLLLSSCRQLGAMGGVGPISLIDILQYLQWVGIKEMGEQRKWVRQLRAMDNAYLKIANKPKE